MLYGKRRCGAGMSKTDYLFMPDVRGGANAVRMANVVRKWSKNERFLEILCVVSGDFKLCSDICIVPDLDRMFLIYTDISCVIYISYGTYPPKVCIDARFLSFHVGAIVLIGVVSYTKIKDDGECEHIAKDTGWHLRS